MRRKRAQATKAFAAAKQLNAPRSWRARFLRFFGHHPPRREWMVPDEERDVKLARLHKQQHYAPVETRDGPEPLDHDDDGWEARRNQRRSLVTMSSESLYTHITGQPRRMPEPRQPARNARDLLPSRFSDTTLGSHEILQLKKDLAERERERALTPAQEYARSWMVQGDDESRRGSYWMKPNHTGGSKNPFRR